MSLSLEAFVSKWAASGAAERANKDSFLRDLCDVLDVPHPDPATGDPELDRYVFEREARLQKQSGPTLGRIDLYKSDCFILEAKQGSSAGSKKFGTAKRDTPGWHAAMQDAQSQALMYARAFDTPPPFLVVVDIGYCIDLYASFDDSWNYRPFPNAQNNRIFLKDLAVHRDTLRKVFLSPRDLDPATHAAKITRDIAGYIANLAKKLEAQKHSPEAVATFLMRCLFTMFAEDVGLLPAGTFTKALREHWVENPASFSGGIESLWRAMNEGGDFFTVGRILKFNGGLFATSTALPLDKEALLILLQAAQCDWSGVEPAIFGTLLERALDPKERHRLGAHFTPRAYVERLVRPTIEEPLRADWDLVQAQVRKLVSDAHAAKSEKDAKKKTKDAATLVKDFHKKLTTLRVLDPACGSGNFLYVTLDLFKRLEGEVLATLEGLGESQELLHMESVRVTPQQFLGIEIKRWAKEIAELVLWIGYLQWHFRIYGKGRPVPEPVLQDYKNIECRDAVLAYDSEELVRDEKTGKPITRWDGETMKMSPVTGEDVPDERAQIPLYRYVNPRKAEWPNADFIVGNPPFVGNKRMRLVLGDGYVDALREAWAELPETTEYVMFWWHRAATLLEEKRVERFGLITTNSITQSQQRLVVALALAGSGRIKFAIPDHPWTDSATGAAVRVAMTVVGRGASEGTLGEVSNEVASDDGSFDVNMRWTAGVIGPDLRCGAEVSGATRLTSNLGLSFMGVTLVGDGFRLVEEDLRGLGLTKGELPPAIRPYRSGRELTQTAVERWVIDFFGSDEDTVRRTAPALYQHLMNHVRPLRAQNKRASYRDRWWVFAEPRGTMRKALDGLPRFIATLETSKHRVFVFLEGRTLPDHSLFAIALADAFSLGVLSSRAHTVWALTAGSTLEDRPRWRNVTCFEPFPFPVCDTTIKSRIDQLGEALDDHRRGSQAAHPDLTITGMYNVLEKLRCGEELTAKEKVVHEQGLVSVLRKLHDDLDAAVFDAYGWPHDLSDEQILERLVALNKERADEEKRGIIRWLRPDFQDPSSSKSVRMKQVEMATAVEGDDAAEPETKAPATKTVAPAWPKKLAEQIASVRDLMAKSSAEWSAEAVAANFRAAKVADVTEVLDSLGALGLLVSYELVEGRRWRSAAFVSVRPNAM